MLASLAGVLFAIGAQAPADTVRDTVFVVSNRHRGRSGFTRAVSDSLWYGIYVTRLVTVFRAAGGQPRALASMHVQRVDSAALTPDDWRARLAAAARDSTARGAVLLFVHGYSSGPAKAVSQGVQVKARGAHNGPLVLFLWPTHDRYLAFPTPSRAYTDDAAAAARSTGAFASVVRTVDSLASSLVVVAHSMGSRIALETLVGDTATRQRLTAHPLRALGIFSPDFDADRFQADYAPWLRDVARRVALYGTSSDYLLGVASVVNHEKRAARFAVRGPPLPGIELVDATLGARAEPAMLTFLGPRHAVRWASAALADFFGIVVSGAPPSCRVTSGEAAALDEGRWKLQPRTMLEGWLGGDCAPQRATPIDR
jgi:hypothetical protein